MVDPAPGFFDSRCHILVNNQQVIFVHQFFADATLVGDDDHLPEFIAECSQGLFYSIIKPEFVPATDIFFFFFVIDDAIAIDKKGPCLINSMQRELIGL